MLAGFRRAGRARGRGPADGVRWEQADAAAALAANGGALAGLRDASILAIASDALLRVSEVAALEFADVNPSDSTVTVRHSKTDPEGAGAVAYLGPATLERIRTWTTAAGGNSGALFRRIAKGGRRVGERLSSRSVRAIIRARATAAGLRDASILAIASDALLRVSEVAALEFADVNPSDSTVTVRHSKTDPEGAGAVAYLGPATLERIRTWTTAAGSNSGALFRRIAKGGRRVGERLSSRSVRAIIRARATAAGVAGRVSGHSLRVGAAQSLAAAGATLVEMQQAGRWRSPAMPGLYVRGQLAARVMSGSQG